MRYPNFNEEKKLWRRGYNLVAGIDEAGRGPLAGPVIAAAVTVKLKTQNAKFKTTTQNLKLLRKIRDSKKLTPHQRKKFYKILTKNPNIGWGIGRVSEKVIDRINILEATKLAIRRAVISLEKKMNKKNSARQKLSDRTIFGRDGFLLVDGNFGINMDISQKSIIKADEKVFSCAAASIIAKVTRDRMILKYHKKYPQYGFDRHKGYPTKLHREMLKKYGPCKIHRRSFRWNP